MRRVVITGMGAVSPLGRGADILVESLLEGKSGITWLGDLVKIGGLRSQVGGRTLCPSLASLHRNIV